LHVHAITDINALFTMHTKITSADYSSILYALFTMHTNLMHAPHNKTCTYVHKIKTNKHAKWHALFTKHMNRIMHAQKKSLYNQCRL